MNGLELARCWIVIHPKAPILLLMGCNHADILREAKKAGVRSVSLKPISTQEFDDMIRSGDLQTASAGFFPHTC